MPFSLIKDLLFKKDRFFKTGNYTQIAVVFSIILDHYGVLSLNKIPIPYVTDALYIFIGINASAAGVFIYLEKRSRVAVNKFCPECGKELEFSRKFKCPTCGDITIGK